MYRMRIHPVNEEQEWTRKSVTAVLIYLRMHNFIHNKLS